MITSQVMNYHLKNSKNEAPLNMTEVEQSEEKTPSNPLLIENQ